MQTRWIVQVNLRMNRTFPNVSDGTLFNRLEVYFFLDTSNGTTDWRSTSQSLYHLSVSFFFVNIMLLAIKASITLNDPKQSKNNSLDIQHSLQECNLFLHLQTKPRYQPAAGQMVQPKKKNSHFFRCVLMLCDANVEQLTLKTNNRLHSTVLRINKFSFSSDVIHKKKQTVKLNKECSHPFEAACRKSFRHSSPYKLLQSRYIRYEEGRAAS